MTGAGEDAAALFESYRTPPPPDALRFVFCTQLHGTHIDPPPSWRHALGLARTAAAAATGGS